MPGTDLVPLTDYRGLAATEDDLKAIQENLQGQDLGEFDLPRIKVPSGGGDHWSVPTLDGEEPRKELQGIVIHSKQSRSWWETSYDESGGNDPPDCSSDDAVLARTREEFEGEIPATVDGDTGLLLCETCKFAQYGSAPEGKGSGRGQACKLSRLLFLLTPERMLPMLVVLPPTSLKPASRFFLNLADYGVRQKGVITRIALESVEGKGVPKYSRAVFAPGERLEPEQIEKAEEYAALFLPYFQRVRVEDASEVAAGVDADADEES